MHELLNQVDGLGVADVDLVLSCSEEAVGDRYQRGGGNMAKAIAEFAGCDLGTGIDIKDFCAAPIPAMVIGASLVESGVFENVVVVGGGSLPKLGMKSLYHLEQGIPVLEDALSAVAVWIGRDDGRSPTVNLQAVGRHPVKAGRALSNSSKASVGGPVRIRIEGGKAREGRDAGVDFAVTLNRASSETVSVDYATADGTAKAGEDYQAVSGTLIFAAGETAKTLHVPVLDDDVDEGREKFEMRLSNPSGAHLRGNHKAATGTIQNTDAIPAALLARFGRSTAEQVVDQVEERMAAPREGGFRARLLGREYRPGMESDFAVGVLSSFAPRGMSSAGGSALGDAAFTAVGSPLAGAFGADTSGMRGMTGMGGTAARHSSAGGAHGGVLFGSPAPGGDLLSSSGFELNRASHGGMLSVWSRSSRSYFNGMEGALSLTGDVRNTMVGADWARGPLTVGLSVGRTRGLGGYTGRSAGAMTTAMTGFYPWLGYRVNDRFSVWAVTGYGKGGAELDAGGRGSAGDGHVHGDDGGGDAWRVARLARHRGFALAFKADALWVGAASEQLDGAGGRLSASEAGATRMRTALEGSRVFTFVGGRLSLAPSVEVGCDATAATLRRARGWTLAAASPSRTR